MFAVTINDGKRDYVYARFGVAENASKCADELWQHGLEAHDHPADEKWHFVNNSWVCKRELSEEEDHQLMVNDIRYGGCN
jgi:hypothetical protein